jgi:NitT/TauT family transport system substrate-binding protein
MNHILKWILIATCAIVIVSCGPPSKGDKSIVLQQQWYANSGFAGETWAQEYLAKERGVDFKVVPGGSDIATTQVVMSGQADFGVAGADQIMLANQNGADLVVVGVINYRTLAAFISNVDKKITLPSDFVGRRIGTMEGTPVDFVFRVMMNQHNIAADSYTEVPTNWTYAGFDKDYDVYPAFVNDEPITFQQQRPDLKLSIVRPHDFGIEFIGTVYFARRDLIEGNPEKVQMFVNLMIDGWKEALRDPEKAMDVLKRYSTDIVQDKEIQSMITGLDYYRGERGKILYASEERWKKMFSQLKSAELVSSFDYDTSINNSFVNWYYMHEED